MVKDGLQTRAEVARTLSKNLGPTHTLSFDALRELSEEAYELLEVLNSTDESYEVSEDEEDAAAELVELNLVSIETDTDGPSEISPYPDVLLTAAGFDS